MNCQEIKEALINKDKEVAEKNLKTTEYFNLIKGDVVSMLISDHINGEFKEDYYRLSAYKVMEILYKKLGVDTSLMHWDIRFTLWLSEWHSNQYKPIFFIGIHDTEISDSLRVVTKKHNNIKENLNFDLFKSLLFAYIRSKGFKQQQLFDKKTGEKYYTTKFKISRNSIENNCCDDVGSVDFSSSNKSIWSRGRIYSIILLSLALLVFIFRQLI